MKKIFAVAVVLGLSSIAFADEAHVASHTSCADLQATAKSAGSITIKTHLGTRSYVATPSDCGAYEVPFAAYEIASDTFFCQIGYNCESRD
jgi:hypothetical protein